MVRQHKKFLIAATLLLSILSSLWLACDRSRPEWSNEDLNPIQLGRLGRTWSVAFSPDSRYLAVASSVKGKGFAIWDVASHAEVFSARGGIDALSFSADGKTLAVNGALSQTVAPLQNAAKLRTVRDPLTLWDTTTWKEKLRPAITDVRSVELLAFHSKEDWLFVTGRNKDQDVFLLLWDLKAGKERYRKVPHKFGIDALALSPDGRTLITGGSDNTAKVWEAASGKELWSFAHPGPGGADRVRSVAFLSDGRAFATAGNDGKIRLWDVKSEKEKAVFSLEYGLPNGLAVSSDGTLLVVATYGVYGRPGLVEFWEVATGKRLANLKVPSVYCLALSPDGKWLATGSKEFDDPKNPGVVELWELAEVLRKRSK